MKNKKFILFTVIIIFIGLNQFSLAKSLKIILIKGVSVNAEVADTKSEREKGLMFRESLSSEAGMIFVYDKEGIHSFWMKNMKFPIDIIWIDSAKSIVEIKTNLKPCKAFCKSYVPKSKAQYVLELNAGFVEKNNIKIGDKVEF